MARFLRFKEYVKINEAFADIAVKQWASLEEAQHEIFDGGSPSAMLAIVNAISRALHLPADKIVHANNLIDDEGVQMFMKKIDDETASKVKTIDLPDPVHSGKNIRIEIYDMKTFMFAYFPMLIGNKPTDNIVISEKALDKLAED